MGYQWQNGVNQGIWNVGGGARVEVNRVVDLDLRYRYVQGMTNQVNNNLVTLGTTFKF
jgi:opacity protein-like surface antigen